MEDGRVPDLLLGVDLGATATTLVVVDAGRGGAVAADHLPARVHRPNPGWAEADPAAWWADVCALVPRVLAHIGGRGTDVAAVAVSGSVPAVLPTGATGRPLRRAILPDDDRAAVEADELRQRLGEADLLAETGAPLTRQSVAPTLVWLATHEPDVWRNTAAVLGGYDWLACVLGADVHVETNWALASGLYTLDGEPSGLVVDAACISGRQLRAPRGCGTKVGTVSTKAAAATGLTAGTPIVVGGAEHVLSAYAAGLTDPGDWLLRLDDSCAALVVSADRPLDRRLTVDAHPAPGRWLAGGVVATGAPASWVSRLTGDVRLDQLDREAAERAPASVVCLPYLDGTGSPLHDSVLRGSFVGLGRDHDRADVYRACLEAVAYGFRQQIEVLGERGVRLGLGRVAGTGARSALWLRILADVLGRPLYPVAGHPGAALGTAAAAGVGIGLYPDWGDAAGVVRLGSPVEPTAKAELAYEEGYQVFLSLQDGLAEASRRLARRTT
ncbi:MAG: carbohydrate kinase [Streptosporangiales bacterium]|nr:carbohydrate kinase [Streptosporangiales bacterium]MBO0891802.1 carbohydrate kinase [Acidothermales bacterium]